MLYIVFAAWVEKRTVHEFECEVLTSDSILKDKRPEQSKQKSEEGRMMGVESFWFKLQVPTLPLSNDILQWRV